MDYLIPIYNEHIDNKIKMIENDKSLYSFKIDIRNRFYLYMSNTENIDASLSEVVYYFWRYYLGGYEFLFNEVKKQGGFNLVKSVMFGEKPRGIGVLQVITFLNKTNLRNVISDMIIGN